MTDNAINIGFSNKPYTLRARAGKYFLAGGQQRYKLAGGGPVHNTYTLAAARGGFGLAGIAQLFQNTPAGGGAPGKPGRMWQGSTNASSILFGWWGPPEQISYYNVPCNWTTPSVAGPNGAPDHYKVYRDGVLIFGNLSLYDKVNNPQAGVRDFRFDDTTHGWYGTQPPLPFFCDNTVSPNTTYSYQVSGVSTAGIEGPLSDPLVATSLDLSAGNGGSGPTLPALVVSPDTWIQPDVLPSGLVWTCTNTTAGSVAGVDNPPGNGKKNSGCSVAYALANCALAGGDILVLTAGATYTMSTSGWSVRAHTGASGWTYVISSEHPLYKPGGALLPSTYDPTPVRMQPYTATGSIASGTGQVTATLTLPWTKKTGHYWVVFSNGEERLVLFTNGSTTIDWSQYNIVYDPNNFMLKQSTNALLTSATSSLRVIYVNSVTPADSSSMPTINMPQSGGGFGFSSSCTKVRFIGLNFVPDPALAKYTSNGSGFLITTAIFSFPHTIVPQGTPVPTPVYPPPDVPLTNNIVVDRCLMGQPSNIDSMVWRWTRAYSAAGGDYFLATQCWQWGFSNGAGADANVYNAAAGGPSCFQNCYFESETESWLSGGLYTAENQLVHDVTFRYNYSHKQLMWRRYYVPSQYQSPGAATGGGLAISAITAANPIKITTSVAQNFQNNSDLNPVRIAGFTTGSWTQLNGKSFQITVIDNQNFTIPVNGTGFTGAITGGTAQQFRRCFNFIKNHFELKEGVRVEVYGGLHHFCWQDGIQGYRASETSFGPLAGHGGGSGAFATPSIFTSSNPWMKIVDLFVHDNCLFNCGTGMYAFSQSSDPGCYTARLLYQNNLIYADTWFNQTNLSGVAPQGCIADLTFDRCTFIINSNTTWSGKGPNIGIYLLSGGSGTDTVINSQSYQKGFPPNFHDRLTITNCIIDCPKAVDVLAPVPAFPSNAAWANLTWSSNLTILDPGTTYPATTYKQVPYGTIGFKNWIDNTMPPLSPQDWNVVGGTGCNGASCAVASTSGGPIGASTASVMLNQDPFPRTYWHCIDPGSGSGTNYAYANPTFRSNAAKFNIVNFNAYMGIEQTMGNTSFATIGQDIKNKGMQNGLYVRTLMYVMSSEQSTVGGGGNASTYTVWSSTINSANWWLRTSYPSGSIVIGPDANSGVFSTASSPNSPTSGGKTWSRAFWDLYDGVIRLGNAVSQGYSSGVAIAANQFLDGYHMDNTFCLTRQTGAWDWNTTSYAAGNATAAAWLQQGQAIQVADIKKVFPGLVIMGNTDYYVHSTNVFSTLVTLDPTQKGLWDLIFHEQAIGAPTSLEGQGGTTTAQFIQNLINAEVQIAPGGAAVLEQRGRARGTAFTSTNQGSWTSADWQAARFGLAIACLRDQFFCLNAADSGTTNAYFMDEVLQQNGRYGWLGRPTDPPQSAAVVKGCWVRNFTGGVVIMNPAGTGVQTINLSADLGLSGLSACASNGFGDTGINTGNPVSSVTLQARDGRFLKY